MYDMTAQQKQNYKIQQIKYIFRKKLNGFILIVTQLTIAFPCILGGVPTIPIRPFSILVYESSQRGTIPLFLVTTSIY